MSVLLELTEMFDGKIGEESDEVGGPFVENVRRHGRRARLHSTWIDFTKGDTKERWKVVHTTIKY